MTYYLRSRQIHQIPVVGALCVAQVEGYYLVARPDGLRVASQTFGCSLLELIHQDQQTAQAHLMPTTLQQFGHFAQRRISSNSFDDGTCLRHFESEQLISFAVLALAGLEEPHQHLPLLLIALRFYTLYDLRCCHVQSFYFRLAGNSSAIVFTSNDT